MYIFIINPVAGNGKAKRIFSKITDSSLYQQLNSRYFLTKYDGHAEEIARLIVGDNLVNLKAIIVIGGDGTLHEVINGVAGSQGQVPIAFIPGGSGNDFARGSAIKGKPMKIFQNIITRNKAMPYWLGNYQIDAYKSRHFINSIGFGFDAEVAKAANDSFYKKLFNFLRIGSFSYVIALIKVLFQFKPFTVSLEVDGVERKIEQCWMVTVANHPYYGGGMKIIPNAKIQPNTFPFLIIHHISKWKILCLFLTVFTGKHIYFKEVELIEAERLNISTNEEICYQVDGQTNRCRSCVVTKEVDAISVLGTN